MVPGLLAMVDGACRRGAPHGSRPLSGWDLPLQDDSTCARGRTRACASFPNMVLEMTPGGSPLARGEQGRHACLGATGVARSEAKVQWTDAPPPRRTLVRDVALLMHMLLEMTVSATAWEACEMPSIPLLIVGPSGWLCSISLMLAGRGPRARSASTRATDAVGSVSAVTDGWRDRVGLGWRRALHAVGALGQWP